MRHTILASLIVTFTLVMSSEATAQVVINMPPPCAKSNQSEVLNPSSAEKPLRVTAVSPMSARVPVVSVRSTNVGRLALVRFTRARIAPGDVYDSYPDYDWRRYYASPYSFSFWPGFFWWGGSGGGHCHGNNNCKPKCK